MRKTLIAYGILCIVTAIALPFMLYSIVQWDTPKIFLTCILSAMGVFIGFYILEIMIGFKIGYITRYSPVLRKRFWFRDGWISALLFLNDMFKTNESKWIISTYDSFEHIDTHSGLFLWPWKLYYKHRGYFGDKITIEKFDPDKVTYWQPV